MVSHYEELNEIIEDVKKLILQKKEKGYKGFLSDYCYCFNFFDFFEINDSILRFDFDSDFENEIIDCFFSGSGLYKGFKVKYFSETVYLICKNDIEFGFKMAKEKNIDFNSSDFNSFLIPYDYYIDYDFYKPLFMVRRKNISIGYQYIFIDLSKEDLWGRKSSIINIKNELISSFCIESSANSNYIICMIYFFGKTLQSFERVNIINLINRFYRVGNDCDLQEDKGNDFITNDSWSGSVNLKQCTPFYYSLLINSITAGGYLKQYNHSFKGDYNFISREWTNTHFSIEHESLR